MTITIRESMPADRPGMLDLWVEAWSRAHPGIDFNTRRAWLDRHLDAKRESGARVFVALLNDGELAGFITVDPGSGEVDQLVTAVSAQRRGVGTRLLDRAKQCSPESLVLSVNAFNASAIQLYEREGFAKVGEGVNAASGLPIWHLRWPAGSCEDPRPGRDDA